MTRERQLQLPAAVGLVVAAYLALAACSAAPEVRPPDMQYGLEECAACRMIVSDPRHAAAVVYGDGRIERFDDIGCLVRHLVEASPAWPPPAEAQIWVHGSEGEWLDARQAVFLHSPGLTTPMGYSWLALEESDAAEALDFQQLEAAVSATVSATESTAEESAASASQTTR